MIGHLEQCPCNQVLLLFGGDGVCLGSGSSLGGVCERGTTSRSWVLSRPLSLLWLGLEGILLFPVIGHGDADCGGAFIGGAFSSFHPFPMPQTSAIRLALQDRKSTRLNFSHANETRMPTFA